MRVELVAAPLPGIGRFAEHHWLLVRKETNVDRWEVWQHADAGGDSWGHLHRNLMPPISGVGNGEGRLLSSWQGEVAEQLRRRIESAPVEYPWRDRYFLWPGPNSNTFVQWILQRRFSLGWRGFGRGYWKHDRSRTAPSK